MSKKETRKIRKSFTWNKSSCNGKYFKSVIKMLDKVKIPNNTGNYIRPRLTRKKKYCDKLKIQNCELDDFHSGNKYLQIILGRFMITSNCFTNCKNYFALVMNKWSLFKNDVFIHYIIRNNFFYKRYSTLPIDPVFPIRIVISNDFLIPPNRIKKTTNFIKEYGHDLFKGKAISDRIVKLISDKHSDIMKDMTKTITSRELCLLYEDNLYFYIVKRNHHKLYEPYVLISKKPLSEIEEIYKDTNYIFEYL